VENQTHSVTQRGCDAQEWLRAEVLGGITGLTTE